MRELVLKDEREHEAGGYAEVMVAPVGIALLERVEDATCEPVLKGDGVVRRLVMRPPSAAPTMLPVGSAAVGLVRDACDLCGPFGVREGDITRGRRPPRRCMAFCRLNTRLTTQRLRRSHPGNASTGAGPRVASRAVWNGPVGGR